MSSRPFSVPIDRRIFLRTGSTVALGFAVLSAIPERLAAAANNPFNPLLGVGFAPDLPPYGTSIRLIDADRLLMPDPAFISRAARVMVAGSHRGDGNRGQAGGLAVDAVFQIRGRTSENYPRFRFWSAADARRSTTSAAVSPSESACRPRPALRSSPAVRNQVPTSSRRCRRRSRPITAR